jgi:hypothetical protein
LRVQKYYEKVYNELKNSKHSEKAWIANGGDVAQV